MKKNFNEQIFLEQNFPPKKFHKKNFIKKNFPTIFLPKNVPEISQKHLEKSGPEGPHCLQQQQQNASVPQDITLWIK